MRGWIRSCLGVAAALIVATTATGAPNDALSSSALRVPIPPALTKPGSGVGYLLDDLLLNGAVQAAREREGRRAARNYQATLSAFVAGLTPEQYQAVLADPVQSQVLFHGMAYVETMRSVYSVSAPRRATSSEGVANRSGAATTDGHTVYSASECIGPVIMGECKGSILPNTAYHQTCHGEMLNGMCTGPMF